MPSRQRPWGPGQEGTVVVIIALGLVALLGMAVLAVDLSYLYAVKSELQRSADAGSAAGARALFFPRLSAPPQCDAALAAARQVAQANLVDGEAPTVSDTRVGHWEWGATFTPGCASSPFTNGVSLTVSKANLLLTFGGVLGLGPVSLQATAIGVTDWVGAMHQGAGFVLALGKKYAKQGDVYIYLNPDPIDGGGWYAKGQTPNNNLIRGYLDNPDTIPAVGLGDWINLNNGAWGDVLSVLLSDWIGKTVFLPVVDTEKYNQSAPVEGFTALTITEVQQTGHKYIRGNALSLAEAPGSQSDPGGVDYGLLTSPRLVK